jgi:hypothetical protein
MSYCPHCNRDIFETAEVDVSGTKYNCVQCAACKAPIGFIEQKPVGRPIDGFENSVAEDLNRVTEALRVVVSSLQTINSRLERLEQAIQARR